MGRGDKKTTKGKIFRGSHGNTRPKNKVTMTEVAEPVKAKSPKKK